MEIEDRRTKDDKQKFSTFNFFHIAALRSFLNKKYKKIMIVQGRKPRGLAVYEDEDIPALDKFKMLHGHAVSLGMCVESRIAVLTRLLREKEAKRVISLLKKAGLPTKIHRKIKTSDILKIIRLDKKTRNEIVMFSLPERIGKMKSKNNELSFVVDEKIIKKAIEESR